MNKLYNLLGYLTVGAVNFLLFIFFSRLLEPVKFGILQIGLISFVFLSIGLLSFIDFSLAYYIARRKRSKSFLGLALISSSGISFVAALIFILNARWFCSLFNIPQAFANEVYFMFVFLALSFVLQSVINLQKIVLFAEARFASRLVLVLLNRLGGSSLSVVLFILYNSLWAISLGLLIGNILPAFLSIRGILSFGVKSFNRTDIRNFLLYSKDTFIINITHQIHSWLDSFMLGAILGPVAVASYAIAYNIYNEIIRIPKVFSETAFKDMVKNISGRRLSQMSASILYVQMPISMALLFHSKQIIRLVFGENYVSSSMILVVLSITLLYSHLWVANIVHLAMKKPSRMSKALVGSTILNAILNLFLIPKFGAIGAGVATTISYSTFLMLSTWFLGQKAKYVHQARLAFILFLTFGTISFITSFFIYGIIIYIILSIGIIFIVLKKNFSGEKIAYVYCNDLRKETANAYQSLKMASELGKIADVTIFVSWISKKKLIGRLKENGIQATMQVVRIPIALNTSNVILESITRGIYSFLTLLLSWRFSAIYAREFSLIYLLSIIPKFFRPRVPIFFESHTIYHLTSKKVTKQMEMKAYNVPSAFIAISEGVKDDLLSLVGEKNILLAHDGADLESIENINAIDLREKFSLPKHTTILVYTGSFKKWKGIDTVIEAAQMMIEKDYHFILVGEKRKNTDNITFIPWIPHSEVIGIIKGSDIVLHPNSNIKIGERYTSPLKVFEYLACGKPIISSSTFAARQILSENNARFFYPEDPASLKDEILQFELSQRLNCIKENLKLSRKYDWKKRAIDILFFVREYLDEQTGE